jgi:uncharacterized membrane protein YeaQ/YmgE (transglycosylase-associated protein family)
MNIALLMLAGGIAGWIGCAYFQLNEDRGLLVSIIIGAVGGYIGGQVLGPMLGAVAAVPGGVSPAALVLGVFVAAACLYAGEVVQERFGF